MDCTCIQFTFSNNSILFREKKYIICAATTFKNSLISPLDQTTPRNIFLFQPRTSISYSYNGNSITFKRSDYGKTHLYVNGKHLVLYLTSSLEKYFPIDEKCVFLTEEKNLEILLYGIQQFNDNACSTCSNKLCTIKTVKQEPENNTLPDDLFEI